MRLRREPDIAGYLYDSHGGLEHDDRNNTVCQIVGRAGTDNEQMEYGPAFLVRFGDGVEIVAYSIELNPWYPT